MTMDAEAFRKTKDRILYSGRAENGIGTLSEKTLHAVLKHFYEPDASKHEVKVGRYVADIYRGDSILEIQTGSFYPMRKKLEYFLKNYQVTVVHPVAHTKWLAWINTETGESTKLRKSPKTGKSYQIFPELYRIKDLLTNKNLSIRVVMLDIEEYRYLSGWSRDRKKGSCRCDRVPVNFVSELEVGAEFGYNSLIPPTLPASFTSKDFKKHSGLSLSASQTALNVLFYVGAVKRVGKQRNAYVYEKNDKNGI